jgi:hypothetical protein
VALFIKCREQGVIAQDPRLEFKRYAKRDENLMRVMQLFPQGFHYQTDERVGNGIRH